MTDEQLQDFEHRLTETTDLAKSNKHRIDEIKKRVDDLEITISTLGVLMEKMRGIEQTVSEIKSDVKSIKEKPGQRWEALAEKIILTIAAAVIGFILAQIGL